MFQPHHFLITVVVDKKDKTPGGLVLPDNYGGVFLTGTVRAVGLGKVSDNGVWIMPKLAPGDRVMIAQHVQHGPQGSRVLPYPTIVDEDVTCIICDYTEVMGVTELLKCLHHSPPRGRRIE